MRHANTFQRYAEILHAIQMWSQILTYRPQGSCKFGQGCALAHILPDGRVINRPPRGQPFAYTRRTHLPPGPSSLLSMQAHDLSAQQNYPYPGHGEDDPLQARYSQPPSMAIPSIDAPLPGDHTSTYGSPPNDSRLGASPSNRGLSVLDAPLPGSFDSQGISHAARHGPLASSVPPRFGIESPPSSLPNKAFGSISKFRGLHGSTFGDAAGLDGVLAGSSPPSFDEPLSFSKRPLHSERLYSDRLARPSRTMMSSSLGTRPSLFQNDQSGTDESDDDGIGEDLLPSSLHELLPQEKLRRFSRQAEEDGNPLFVSAQRRAISSGNVPQDSKIGSMSPHSSSPSRYNALFTSRSLSKGDLDLNNNNNNNSPSAFGHVGSPLRPSTLRSSSLVNAPTPPPASSDFNPYAVGSPPRQASMSMLTQELQRTQLSEYSKASGPPGPPRPARNSLAERGLSNSSLGRGETIEEEQAFFSMEEDSEPGSGINIPLKSARNPIFKLTPGKSEPTVGPIGNK